MDPKLWSIYTIGTLMAAAALILVPSKEAGAVDDNVSFVELFKLHERWDGIAFENPYEFEACVDGAGVTGATVTLPDDVTQVTLETDPDEHDYCYFEQFASATELDIAFPDGEYTFEIFIPGGSDFKTVDFSTTYSQPKAWLDVIEPDHDATNVPHDSDLDVTWDVEMESMCTVGVDCFDGIAFFLHEDVTDEDVDEQFPLVDATGVTVLAEKLEPGKTYDIELETWNGFVDLSGTQETDLGDAIDLVAIWEDLNMTEFTTVPEPAAVVMQISVLATLGWLARRRRNLR